MTFHDPSIWFLLLLLLLPLFWWRWRRTSHHTGITFSVTSDADLLPQTIRTRTLWVPMVLRTITVILLIVCIARPQKRFERIQQSANGVAIELVIDRSPSMYAHDFTIDNQPVDRLTAVKRVAGEFINGIGNLEGRSGDLIGLITFARYADSNCPMTFDHEFLVSDVLQSIQIVRDRQEDGTAIGDAIALAVERLASLDAQVASATNKPIESKVIILLTDGENNQGDIDPQTAADMAAAMDITVYTIGAGINGVAPFPVTDLLGRTIMRNRRVTIDEKTLQDIATTTGGTYFRATDTASLAGIYAKIDEMEQTEMTKRTYVNHIDVAVKQVNIAGFVVPPLLLITLVFLLLDTLLRSTVYRIID